MSAPLLISSGLVAWLVIPVSLLLRVVIGSGALVQSSRGVHGMIGRGWSVGHRLRVDGTIDEAVVDCVVREAVEISQ